MAQGIFTKRQQLRGLIEKSWYNNQPTLPSFSTYQASLNGTNQTLSIADSANIRLGSGDFTIECWTNTTYANGGTTAAFACQYPDAAGAGSYIFGIRAGVIFIWDNATSYTAATTINTGSWTHIAWVRSGSGTNNNTVYVNGKTDLQFTNTTNFTGASYQFQIGRWGTSSAILSGYVSNLRIVKGTAVYTGNFNPPTAALTAITNTQLLTLQGSTIVDNSTNAFSITNNGSVGMTVATIAVNQTVAPSINPPSAVEYLVVAGGGAGGTDRAGGGGAGGLLQGILPITLGTSYTVTVGAGGTTVAGNANPTGGNGQNSVFGNITAKAGGGGSGGDARYNGYQPASGGSGGGESTGDIGNLQGAQGTAGQGNSGGTSGPHSGNYNAAGGGGAGTVGLSAAGTVSGNGGAGIASSITGSVVTYAGGGGGGTYGGTAGSGGIGGGGAGAAGTSAIAGSSGSSNSGGGGGGGGGASGAGGSGGSGIAIISYSDTYNAPTALTGTYTASTSGSGSVLFSGTTNQGLVYTNLSSLSSVSGNFTIEYWMYVTAYGSYQTTISSYPAQPSIYVCHQFLSGSSSTFSFGTSAGSSTFTASLNTWYHIAQVRVGSTITNYVNGVSIGTYTATPTFNLSTLAIGNYSTTASSYTFNGNISNLRIVTSALYTSNFTPSTTPLTAISGTGMLINTVSGAPFVDSSTNMASVALLSSSVASPTWNQSSPFATGLGYKNRVYTWTGSGTVTF